MGEPALPSRKSFLIRLDPDVLDAVRRWADDDLRSMNGQIEFLLRKALRETSRLGGKAKSSPAKKPQKPVDE
ncbi:MAG: Arc family DNA-binding protein [Pirellulaceae bacterium]|nr:Arc family DNA-binding protein [Pirellulaceae bacterium]